MKNRSFVRLWAPLIAALVFAIAFLATHFVMNPAEKAKAVTELNALIDIAEARTAAVEEPGPDSDAAADSAAIHKARTMERFLAHDDSLLQTDALLVLCELTDIERAAVLDGEGGVIAASDASLIGQSFAADAALGWSMALLQDGAAPTAGADGQNVRMAGAPRTDIDGIVLIWSRDAVTAPAVTKVDIHDAVENLAVAPDAIKLVETVGEDGVFEQDGMLYVQRAGTAVTLIAYRPLAEVYAVQNAVLTALAVFAAVSILTLFLWQLVTGRGGRRPPRERVVVEAPAEAPPQPEEAPEPVKRRRRGQPPVDITEDVELEAAEIELDYIEDLPPRPRKRGPRSVGRTHSPADEPSHDDSFDKIFE